MIVCFFVILTLSIYITYIYVSHILYDEPFHLYFNKIYYPLTDDSIKENKEIDKFPIDIVITWVNSQDKDWIELKNKYSQQNITIGSRDIRFANFGSLKYVLRGIYRYMNWVRNIFITSANQSPPDWLIPNEQIGFPNDYIKTTNNRSFPNLVWINHSSFIPQSALPTFNSHAIEACIHNIDELSEHFIYFNSDFFVNDYIKINDMFDNAFNPKIITSNYKLTNNKTFNSTKPKDWTSFLIKNIGLDEFRYIKFKMYSHTAMPFTKTLLKRACAKYNDLWQKTIHNKFRTYEDDISPFFISYCLAYKDGNIRLLNNKGTARCITVDISQKIKNIDLSNCKLSCINLSNDKNREYSNKILEGNINYIQKLYEKIWNNECPWEFY